MRDPLAALDIVAKATRKRTPCTMDLGTLTPAAVAVILHVRDGEINIVLTVRADTVEHHKNEISFPGGRVDQNDATDFDAALRETWEEIGVPSTSLRLLGRLDDFRSISGYRVRPFVVQLTEDYPEFLPQPDEVSEIIEIPLEHLLDPSNHRVDTSIHPLGKPVQFFYWEGRTVWGLTGAILRQLLEVAFGFDGEGENGDG